MKPGRYSAELLLISSDGVRSVAPSQEFEVKPVPTAPPGTDFNAMAAFQQETSELMRQVANAGEAISETQDRLRHMRAALLETPRASANLFTALDQIETRLAALRTRLLGDPIRGRLDEASMPSIRNRVGRVTGHWDTRQTPTETFRGNLAIARADFGALRQELTALIETQLAQLETDLEAAGAPWTPGRRLLPR